MNRPGAAAALLLLCLLPAAATTAAEYGFDLEEFEKKRLNWGGFAEVRGEHFDHNREGALYILNQARSPRSALDRLASALQIDGSWQQGITSLNWLLKATASQDQAAWEDSADVYTAYASIKASPRMTLELGKKTFKWGKGYAWNPVAFIDRAKDPEDPEEAMEGFITAGTDLVRSLSGPLQTAALTAVALPVWQGVNEDFGAAGHTNFAARLYLLYRDTDIDLVYFTGDSRSSRYGFDFSKNLATNFEVHGELAHTPAQRQRLLTESGDLAQREVSDTSFLAGIRYLSERDVTTIIEYYHNGDGYTEDELSRFFSLAKEAGDLHQSAGGDALLGEKADLARSGYAVPQAGRNYLYARITIKEPWDVLYFSPGLTGILNLDDRSYSAGPELLYTGFTNFELRARLILVNGGSGTEYGEKQNRSRFELRLRYFF